MVWVLAAYLATRLCSPWPPGHPGTYRTRGVAVLDPGREPTDTPWAGNPPRSGRIMISRMGASAAAWLVVSALVSGAVPVSYTHLRAHETRHDLVCRLLLEK